MVPELIPAAKNAEILAAEITDRLANLSYKFPHIVGSKGSGAFAKPFDTPNLQENSVMKKSPIVLAAVAATMLSIPAIAEDPSFRAAQDVGVAAMALALVTIMPFGADALELKPLQAGTFVLGAQSVSIYYTVSGDTYEVVATIAPDGGTSGAPIRLVGFLQPGQKALISTGQFDTTAAPDTLELVHQGNLLSATAVTNVALLSMPTELSSEAPK